MGASKIAESINCIIRLKLNIQYFYITSIYRIRKSKRVKLIKFQESHNLMILVNPMKDKAPLSYKFFTIFLIKYFWQVLEISSNLWRPLANDGNFWQMLVIFGNL